MEIKEIGKSQDIPEEGVKEDKEGLEDQENGDERDGNPAMDASLVPGQPRGGKLVIDQPQLLGNRGGPGSGRAGYPLEAKLSGIARTLKETQ